MTQSSFSSLGLLTSLVDNLPSLGFSSMTTIQTQSLPFILAGHDVIAQGQTGSGKTAAFGLGLLNKLESKNYKVQSLVLCPTRELAEQIAEELRRLARKIPNIKVLTVYGGTPIKAQATSLAKGTHIVVGTPGRVEDHLLKGNLQLDQLTTLVLDEADRMLDMGFHKTLDAIIEQVPDQRQTLLFSATFPEAIEQVGGQITRYAKIVKVAPNQDGLRIDQAFFTIDNEAHRLQALQLLLLQEGAQQSAVFCNTKADAQIVAGGLKSAGFSAAPLHSDMEQKDRDQTLIRFANNSILVLVATDVAARGLDIESLDVVFNYHLPREVMVYTHRIGRTGRAGEKGKAFTLYQASEKFRVEQLESYLNTQIKPQALPASELLGQAPVRPAMSTLRIEGGKKQKLRPGDLVGALTKGEDINGDQIGKIQVMDNWAYLALARDIAKIGLKKINNGKIKGKRFRARLI